MAFTILTGGSYTSTGANQIIPLPSSADYFRTWNFTQMTASSPTAAVSGEWFGSKFGAGASPVNDGIRWKMNGSNAILIDKFSASTAGSGFTYVTSLAQTGTVNANAITGITLANPAVVSQTNTYSNGNFVRIYNTTGDLTIGGMVFQVSSVSGSAYTLLGLPNTAANGLAAATAGNSALVPNYMNVEPQFMFVTGIAAGTAVTAGSAGTAIISTSIDPTPYYVVGNKIHFTVPSSFGMVQMDQLTGTITQINISNSGGANVAAYNVVVNIDVSAFTAFTFPASAASPTTRLFATFSPAGSQTSFNPVTLVQTGYEFFKTPFHTGQFLPYMLIGGGTNAPGGANLDVINWMAYKLEA